MPLALSAAEGETVGLGIAFLSHSGREILGLLFTVI
jgi:hypothetical protein